MTDLTHEDVRKIIELVDAAEHLDEIELEYAGYRLHLRRGGSGDAGMRPASFPPAAKPAPKAATKATGQSKPQFSDASGNSWGGRGPRPAWLREALQAGRDINEFRIGKRAKAKKMPVPLGAAIAAATASPASTPAAPTRAAATPAATAKSARVSYGDDAGHSWSGMGPKPGWLKAAIESGKALADFVK